MYFECFHDYQLWEEIPRLTYACFITHFCEELRLKVLTISKNPITKIVDYFCLQKC